MPMQSASINCSGDNGADNAALVLVGHRLQDGVARVDGHARPPYLGGVDAVTAQGGSGLHDACHLCAGLEQLIGHDQPHVAGADHQHPLANRDAVDIDHGLDRAGAYHAGEGPAGEGQGIF